MLKIYAAVVNRSFIDSAYQTYDHNMTSINFTYTMYLILSFLMYGFDSNCSIFKLQ